MTTPITTPLTTLSDRLNAVRANIAAACARANRTPDSVRLIAVSKTHPAESVLEAVVCGQFEFGENRIEEAAHKIQEVRSQTSAKLKWHMIGHVQSRKAQDVVAAVDIIQSLDSLKLAERYSRFATEMNRAVSVLLEVNVTGEESKSGFAGAHWQTDRNQKESLWNEFARIIELPGLRVEGLMTMAPLADDPELARPTFVALRALRDSLAASFPRANWETLSMGMTDDYPVAIEEGATMVRIGRAIFGERKTV